LGQAKKKKKEIVLSRIFANFFFKKIVEEKNSFAFGVFEIIGNIYD
jgi:hypothetical protein